MQIYSGMNCDDPGSQFNAETQQQVKYDYRYNIAMGSYMLKKWKWDWHKQNGRIIGDGDPHIVEHWYYAVWAYHQWTAENSPNNLDINPCPGWPENAYLCAYQDKVWWWAANPPSRGGHALWSAVNLTRPDPSLFPENQAQMDSWPDWHIADPTPMHRDSCRNYVPVALKNYPSCNPARWTWCGHTDTYNNSFWGSTDMIDFYSCVSWDESGPEYAYSFVPNVTGTATARLSDMYADLDVFVLDGSGGVCSPSNCIAFGGISATFNVVAGHTYYIVVDGYKGAVSFYNLRVTCSGN